MVPARCTILLAAAHLACAGAHFGRSGVGAPMGRARYHRRRLMGTSWGHQAVVAAPRGGGDGIEENPEYDGDEGGDASDDENVDSSDAAETDEGSLSEEELVEPSDDDDDATETSVPNHHRRSKSRKAAAKSGKASLNKRLVSFAKCNQLNFYILLAIIAFRRDIYFYTLRILPTRIDSDTGRRKLSIQWSTDVLKLIVVGALAYRFLLPDRGDGLVTSDSPRDETNRNQTEPVEQTPRPRSILPLLLLLSLVLLPTIRNNIGMFAYFFLPILLRILSGESDPDSPLSRLLLTFGRGGEDMATRMAYLPPLEQHYAFEQLNERYYRDWGAWRKAHPTNALVAATDSNKPVDDSASMASMASSLISGRRRSMQARSPSGTNAPKYRSYPNTYNNGTVIVLDMTKLDTKASRMEAIRDQISFVVHLVQTEDPAFFSQHRGKEGKKGHESNVTAHTNETVAEGIPITNHSSSDANDVRSGSPTIEVVVLLESPGGGVSEYGLAASHLQRLRDCTPSVKLTVCVDTVAASGGYMMASVASPGQLFCAPFAVVGSIGVIGQSLNIQKTLEGYGVRPYVFTGGKLKNPVGMVGEVTKDGIDAMQDTIDRIHEAFKSHVLSGRREAFSEAMLSDAFPKPAGGYFQLGSSGQLASTPGVSIEQIMDTVASGEIFLGTQALKLGLVDRLITSDEYLAERMQQGARVLKLINYHRHHVGLSSLLAPHPQRGPALATPPGLTGLITLMKRLVLQAISALMAWADDGLSSPLPNFSAAGIDFQGH